MVLDTQKAQFSCNSSLYSASVAALGHQLTLDRVIVVLPEQSNYHT
jgi:hypothetical protein